MHATFVCSAVAMHMNVYTVTDDCITSSTEAITKVTLHFEIFAKHTWWMTFHCIRKVVGNVTSLMNMQV